jgi:transglutaminase superfamily protein
MTAIAQAPVTRSIPTRLSVAAKALLAGEILLAYIRVRHSVRRADFQAALQTLRSAGSAPKADRVGTARLGRAVARTLRVLPTDSRCLMQSLVLTTLLARRGIPSLLVIGVSSRTEFEAHAWVESAGVPLLPSHEHLYQRLVEL